MAKTKSGYVVKDIMKTKVVSADSNSKIIDCAKIMAKKKIGCLILTNQKSIVGIVTEQDLARKVVAADLSPKRSKVKTIMTKNILSVLPEQDIQEAIEVMRSANIKHLPVMRDGKLKGVISSKDIVRRLNADKYLFISSKKIILIIGIWVLSVIAHNLLSGLLGIEEVVFFSLAVFVIPAYFVATLLYTAFRYKLTRKPRRKRR